MTTADLIEALREDIRQGLREELLSELQPEIDRRLHGNIFDVKELCNYLKVSDRTIRRMVKEDRLPHFWQRGQIYFRQTSIDRWISQREQNVGIEVSEV